MTFYTPKFVRRLRDAGLPEAQAEAIAAAFAEAQVEAEVATRYDLRELEYRLVIKLGVMTLAAVGAVATLVKLL